ncbi:hypothetical protein BJV77DRAFT_604113 [Russula vinacea]|nr:hypothetical protein BJV77DRAFT_604113 [Russula vinacea]
MNSELPLSAFSPCPATPSNAKHLTSDLRPAEVSAWADTPSTIGSILVDPPHMATILNHTRIPVLHERPHKGSNAEQPIAMAITTRARRGHRNLQLPSGRRASTSDTYLSPVSPTEPVKPALAPAYHNGSLLSSTNTANRPSIVAPHLIPKEDGTLAPVSKRNAHRRSASYGSSRPPIPGIWDAGLDSIRKARIRGLKSDKENIISTLENAGMRSSGHPKPCLPMTPSRERALLSSDPSPASSSELSPLGQKMMADLRRRKSRFAEAAVTHV